MEKPLEKLLFLVRDWQWPNEKPFGSEGGQQLVERCLRRPVENQRGELVATRTTIKSCFKEINGFLMPHPGNAMAYGKFSGFLRDLDDEFKNHLTAFMQAILSPKSFRIKRVGEDDFSCQHLVNYFQECINSFNESGFNPETLYDAQMKWQIERFVNQEVERFRVAMEGFCCENTFIHNSVMIDLKMKGLLESARQSLERRHPSFRQLHIYLDELSQKVELEFELHHQHNQSKIQNCYKMGLEYFSSTMKLVCCESQSFTEESLLTEIMGIFLDQALSMLKMKVHPESCPDEFKEALTDKIVSELFLHVKHNRVKRDQNQNYLRIRQFFEAVFFTILSFLLSRFR